MRIASFFLFVVGLASLFSFPARAQVTVTMDGASFRVGEQIRIPVEITNTDGLDITSYEVTLAYAGDVIEITSVESAGFLSAGMAPVVNYVNRGEIQIAAAGSSALTGAGVLFELVGEVHGEDLFGERIFTPQFKELLLFDSDAQPVNALSDVGAFSVKGIELGINTLTAPAGGSFSLPITIGSISGFDITAYQFTVDYDPGVISISSVSKAGSLSESGSLTINNDEAGRVRVAYAGSSALGGAGNLLYLEGTRLTANDPLIDLSAVQFFDSDGQTVPVGPAGFGALPPTVSGNPGDRVTLFVPLGNADGLGLIAYQFSLEYDPGMLNIVGTSTAGTLSEGKTVISNVNSPGFVSVAWAEATPLEGDGPLVGLTADILQSGNANLRFTDYKLVGAASGGGGTGTSGAPDLIVESFSVSPTTIRSGDKLQIDLTIKNIGDKDALAFQTNFRLNTSSTEVTTDDILLYSCQLDGLAAGQSTGDCSVEVTIPDGLSGSTYYVWVILDVNSEAGQVNEENDKANLEVSTNDFGTTVIIHGHRGIELDGDDGLLQDQEWVLTMAQAIVARTGMGKVYVIGCNNLEKEAGGCGGHIVGPDALEGIMRPLSFQTNDTIGERVIVFDWLEESTKAAFGYAEAAADALTALLIKGAKEGIWNLNSLHFIGHSRGSVIASETIQRLGFHSINEGGFKVGEEIVDRQIHFTALDPHPWDNESWDFIGEPLGWGSAEDHAVNDFNPPITFLNAQRKNLGVVCWKENVGYCENYWQNDGGEGSLDLDGLSEFPGLRDDANHNLSTTLEPLNPVLGGNRGHSTIHRWYHGTINTGAEDDGYIGDDAQDSYCVKGEVEDACGRSIDSDWYTESDDVCTRPLDRFSGGYNRSKSGGGLANLDCIKASSQLPSIFDDVAFQANIGSTLFFNGDFGKRANLDFIAESERIPGWSLQGGACTGNIVDPLIGNNWQLSLNKNDSYCTHNWTYFPKGTDYKTLRYKIKAINPFSDDKLIVKIDNEEIDRLDVKELGLLFREESINVESFQGSVQKLTFELLSESSDINSSVRIDNICFGNCPGYLSSSIAYKSSSAKNNSVVSAVRLHAYDSMGNHTGFIDDSTFVEDIPGSRLTIYEDSLGNIEQSVYVPEGQTYEFEIESLAGSDAADFVIEDATHAGKTVVTVFEGLVLPAGSKATTTLSETSPNLKLFIDQDGNGVAVDSLGVTEHLEEYIMRAKASPGGEISPEGATYVAFGDKLTYDITPGDGFRIGEVFVDSVSVGAISTYTFETIDADHRIEAVFISETSREEPAHPESILQLHPNYPNPFRSETTITYNLPEPGEVHVAVYDLMGRMVERLIDGWQPQGQMELVFNATELPSGVYVVELRTAQGRLQRLMTHVR